MDPETASHSQFSSKVMNRMTLKETLSVHKLKKRPGIFSMFGNKVIFTLCLMELFDFIIILM